MIVNKFACPKKLPIAKRDFRGGKKNKVFFGGFWVKTMVTNGNQWLAKTIDYHWLTLNLYEIVNQ